MKSTFYSILFLFAPLLIVAQNFTAAVSQTEASVNERIVLQFVATGSADDFSPPENLYRDFQVSGPSTGSQYSNVNGKSSSKTTWTYEIKPKKEGRIVIGAASVKSNGNKVKSNTIAINVVPASQRKIEPNSPQAKANKYSEIKVLATPRSVYVGQPISVMYKAFNRSQWEISQGPTQPDFVGFTKENFKHEARLKQEIIDGQRQNTVVLDKFLLFPQKPQEFKNQQLSLDLVTGIPTGRRDFWGQPELQGVSHTISAKFPTIIVKPLPANAPASFTGAVGSFDFNVSLSRNELNADESATLTISLSGKGNTKLVTLPKIQIPDDLETYDPKYIENINLQTYGYSGSKKEEYLLIPRYKGVYKIPSIAFTYFDLVKEQYVTVNSDPLELTVLTGPESQNTQGKQNNTPVANSKNIQNLGSDILFIKTDQTVLFKEKQPFFRSLGFYLFMILGLAGISLPWILFGVGKKLKVITDHENSSLSKEIKKQLALAEKAQKAQNKKALLEHVNQALSIGLEKATGLKLADLNQSKIQEKLKANGYSTEVIAQCLAVLNNIEMARFAPMQKTQEEQLLADTKAILTTLKA